MARQHLPGAIARTAVLIELALAINHTLLDALEHRRCRCETAIGEGVHDRTGRPHRAGAEETVQPQEKKKAAAETAAAR
jgi:hypothetical protein